MSEESPLQNPGELTEHPLCILCVDDEVDILASLTRLFRREPFKVLTATSGEEGLALLKRTENVGLIISDYRMPVMNGSTFLKSAALLAPDSYRMILTGYADMNAAIEAINEGGASRFMSKPAENDELLHTVRDGLLLYRKTRENQRLTALVTQQNEELEEWNANLKKRCCSRRRSSGSSLKSSSNFRKPAPRRSVMLWFLRLPISWEIGTAGSPHTLVRWRRWRIRSPGSWGCRISCVKISGWRRCSTISVRWGYRIGYCSSAKMR